MRAARLLALVQGGYFVATGLWAILHIASFMAVTGPKTDLWLVRTVAVLVIAVGGTLLTAGVRDRVTREVAGLAVACALGLAAVDIVYALADVILDVYLLDAVVEVALAIGWASAWPARGVVRAMASRA